MTARIVTALLLAMAVVSAQDHHWRTRGYERDDGVRDDGTSICTLRFRSNRSEPHGSGWTTDFPRAANNLLRRAGELTTFRPAQQWVVDGRVDTDALSLCPIILASDVGTLEWQAANEVHRIRAYLRKGGFLWADDFWGDESWTQWEAAILDILPGARIVNIGPEHELFAAGLYAVDVPQVSNLHYWRSTGGRTSEQGAESEVVNIRGIHDDRGRLMVLMTHNTDIFDTWEQEAADASYFDEFAGAGYSFGINVLLYALMR